MKTAEKCKPYIFRMLKKGNFFDEDLNNNIIENGSHNGVDDTADYNTRFVMFTKYKKQK